MANDPGLTVVSDDTPGIHAISGSDAGVWAESTDDNGVYAASTNSDAVVGFASQGAGVSGSSIAGIGVIAFSDDAPGVSGASIAQPGVLGTSAKHYGVVGQGESLGVLGRPTFIQGPTVGVTGISTEGFGVLGSCAGTVDREGRPFGVGVWGESTSGGVGAAALTKGTYAFFALTRGRTTAKTEGPNSANGVAGAFGGDVTVDGSLFITNANDKVEIDGSLVVFGNKKAAVPHPDGSHRSLYCMESPESWFEDFGRARLVGGKARVRLDRTFAAVVRTGDYHIFLAPEGDSRGLYVGRRTRGGFEVREQQGGTSTLGFSYRVVARRKDVHAPRFERVRRQQFRPVRLAQPKISSQPKAPAAPRRPRPPKFLARAASSAAARGTKRTTTRRNVPKAAALKPLHPMPLVRPTAPLPTPPAPPKHAFNHAGARRRRRAATPKRRRRTAKRS